MPMSLFERVVSLINEASLSDSVREKVTRLTQVKELIVHRDSSLLDNFFEEVAAFQHDLNFEVRRVVIDFIQEACQVDPTLLKKGIGYLFFLFSTAIQQDPPSLTLLRCLIHAMIPVYRIALTRAVKIGIVESGVIVSGKNGGIAADSAADIALETFRNVASLKDEIVRLVLPMAVPGQSAFGFIRPALLNDGVRSDALALVQSIIILHSRRLPNSDIPRSSEGDISLDQIPDMTNAQLQEVLDASTAASSASLLPGVCLVRPRRLAEEAERLLTGLLDWPIRGASATNIGPISCAVLELVMDSLVNVARQRPQFMDRIVQAFETVHVTLPPYFSDVQVSSVRKKLKAGLLQLLRCSAAVTDYQGRITILLTDLGATQNEVFEALHRINEFPLNRDAQSSLEPATAHGDVDMRQMRRDFSTASTVAQANKPHPDASKTHFPDSQSSTQPPYSTAAASSTTTTTTMETTSGSTPSRAPQAGQAPTPKASDSAKSFSSGFSLAQAEAALRFDDDDDDDDDIQIISSQRSRSNKAKRHSFTTASSTTAGTGSKETKGSSASGTTKPEIPSVDLITTRLVPRLTAANVADLVLLSMVTLPDQMPAAFQSTYTPIAAAGTSAQIRHLARLLAVQLVVWAGESSQGNMAENVAQLESVLRPTEDELGEMPAPRHKRGSKSDLGSGTDGGATGEVKETVRAKKRRLAAAANKAAAGDDAEVEDALIRANAARRMHGAQPMNISTLVGYGQKQQQEDQPGIPISPVVDGSSPAGVVAANTGLPQIFPTNVHQPGGANLLLASFNPSQPPPPLMMMMMSNALNQSAQNPAFAQIAAAAGGATAPVPPLAMADIPLPTPARPFSLEAVTGPIGLTTQRQLAHDAFLRIIEGLEGSAARFPTATSGTNQSTPAGADSLSASSSFHLNRMKLLTRLTTRRFGGNEFYKILIEYAIKNLRHGFELLSKLLMQEYCRSRGFQLVGFNAYLESRRHQLVLIRERQQRRKQSAGSDESGASKLTEDPEQSQKNTATDNTDSSSSSVTTVTDGQRIQRSNEEDDNDAEVTTVASQVGEELAEDSNRFTAGSSPKRDADGSNTSKKKEDPVESKSDGLKKDETRSSVTNYKMSPAAMRERKPISGNNKILSATPPDDLGCLSFYDCLLVDILQRLKQPDLRQTYFGRFLIEAPLLTAGAISVLKRYCSNPSQSAYGFQVLRTLIELRPVGQREYLLNMLLSFCSVEDTEIRHSALVATRELANLDVKWQHHIEAFATKILRKLTHSRPSADIFPFANHPLVPQKWNDESCQSCAHLFLGLMPQSPSLMHKLAEVYVSACPEVKRCILRMIDQPIREIGIYSTDLHDLVDQCPLGAETLITRMIHLLTDSPSAAAAAAATASATAASVTAKSATGTPAPPVVSSSPPPVIMPPASLVERVYRLYQERVHDVRCLIPVLVGLSKQEVISALPRLIQLNEKVVKEVLTRLLNASVSTQYAPRVSTVRNMQCTTQELLGESPLGPLKPEELLVAIHLLEFAKDQSDSQPAKPLVSLQDILHACRVCFSERRLFTQDRLSAAIGQLLEQPVLPTLFMRTVMQALALHPRLAGYVINVLSRLIRKQVWKSKQLWDGFIRCCIKLHPQSYQVLLQLPPERLESVFQREPTMRAQVRRYVENFSSAQRVHISKSIIAVLERAPTPPPQPETEKCIPQHDVVHINGAVDAVAHTATTFPSSPASSGPATPTRDEIPAHEVQAAIAAAAAIFQNPVSVDSSEPHVNSKSSDSDALKVESSTPAASTQPQHPLSVLVCNRSIGALIGAAPSESMDERYQYVPRFRPSGGGTRSYMRARNRSPHQEDSPPSPEKPEKKESTEQHRRRPSTVGEPPIKVKRVKEPSAAPVAPEPTQSTDLPTPPKFTTPLDDDDLEPPVLPATRIKSTVPRRWRDLERSQVEKPTDSSANTSVETTKSGEELNTSIAPVSEQQTKHAVDLDKLEAARKQLLEDASKLLQQNSETTSTQSSSDAVTQQNPSSKVNSPPKAEST